MPREHVQEASARGILRMLMQIDESGRNRQAAHIDVAAANLHALITRQHEGGAEQFHPLGVAPVGGELGDFVAALAASDSLRDVLASPQIDVAAKQRVLAEITRDGQPLVANALQLLLERGRFSLVGEVDRELRLERPHEC